MSRIPSLSSVSPWQDPMRVPDGKMPDEVSAFAAIGKGVSKAGEQVGDALASISIDAMREQNQVDFFEANAEFRIKVAEAEAKAASIDDIALRESTLRTDLLQARDEIKKKFPTRHVQDRFDAGANAAIAESSSKLKVGMAEIDRQNRVSRVVNIVSDLFWTDAQAADDMLDASVQAGILQRFQADAIRRELYTKKESMVIDAALRGPDPQSVFKLNVNHAKEKHEQAKYTATAMKALSDAQGIRDERVRSYFTDVNTLRALDQKVGWDEVHPGFLNILDSENFTPEDRRSLVKTVLLPQIQTVFEESLFNGDITSKSQLSSQPWAEYLDQNEMNAFADQVSRYNSEVATVKQALRVSEIEDDITNGKILPLSEYRAMIGGEISYKGFLTIADKIRPLAAKQYGVNTSINAVKVSIGTPLGDDGKPVPLGAFFSATGKRSDPLGPQFILGTKETDDASNVWYTGLKGQALGEGGLNSIFTEGGVPGGTVFLKEIKAYIDTHHFLPPDAVNDFQNALRDKDLDAAGVAQFLDRYVYGDAVFPNLQKQLGQESLDRIKYLRGSKTDRDVAKAQGAYRTISDENFTKAFTEQMKYVKNERKGTFGYYDQVRHYAAGKVSQGTPPDMAIKAAIDYVEKQFSVHYEQEHFMSPMKDVPSEKHPAMTELMIVQSFASRLGITDSNEELARFFYSEGFSARAVTNAVIKNQSHWDDSNVSRDIPKGMAPRSEGNLGPDADSEDAKKIGELDYSGLTRQEMLYFAIMTGILGDPNMKGASAEERTFFSDWRKYKKVDWSAAYQHGGKIPDASRLDQYPQAYFAQTGLGTIHPLERAHGMSKRYYDLGYKPFPSSRPGEWLLMNPNGDFDASSPDQGYTSVNYRDFHGQRFLSRFIPAANNEEARMKKEGDISNKDYFMEIVDEIGDGIVDTLNWSNNKKVGKGESHMDRAWTPGEAGMFGP